MKNLISGKTWEVKQNDKEVVFKCKICGFSVHSHIKHWETAYIEILEHIAETHAHC